MGTLKVDSKPQRSSNSGVQASAKKSRLPTAAGAKLGGVSSASKNRGRSGSTGGRPGSIESVSRVSAGMWMKPSEYFRNYLTVYKKGY